MLHKNAPNLTSQSPYYLIVSMARGSGLDQWGPLQAGLTEMRFQLDTRPRKNPSHYQEHPSLGIGPRLLFSLSVGYLVLSTPEGQTPFLVTRSSLAAGQQLPSEPTGSVSPTAKPESNIR